MLKSKTLRRFAGLTLAGLMLSPFLEAQTSPNDEEIIQLDPFKVSDDSIQGYLATQSVSLNRATTEIVDIPQAINVITREYIEDSGAMVDMEILKNTSPGVTLRNNNAMDVTIRGFRSIVGSLDGAVMRTITAVPASVLDRVEVVKGPASLLYGSFSAAGGYVNRITKKPTKEFQGSVTATVGTDSLYRGMADISGPISDNHPNILYRVVVEGSSGDIPGYAPAFDNSKLTYGRLTFNLSPKAALDFGVLYQDRNHTGLRTVIDLKTASNGTRANPGKSGVPLRGFDLGQPFDEGKWDIQMTYVDVRFTAKPTEDIGFQAFYAMEYGESGGNFFSGAGGAVPASGILNVTGTLNDGQTYHHNAQTDITWKTRTSFLENRVTAGGDMNYRSNENRRGFSNRAGSTGVQAFDYNNVAAYANQPQVLIPWNDRTNSTELAGGFFVQDELSFLDNRLILTGGLRYNYVTSQRLRANAPAAVDPATGQFIPGVNLGPYQGEAVEDDYMSERYGVVVKPLPNLSAFWGSTDAFRGNGTALLVGGGIAPPEISTGIEYGVKMDSVYHFTGTVSFFDINVTNRLQDDPNNVGFKRIRPPLNNEGWEASLAWDYEGLTIMTGYYSGKLIDKDSGLRPDVEPDQTFNLAARYKFAEDSSLSGLSFGGGTNWVGEALTDGGSRTLGSYQTVDVFATYKWDKWKAQLNGSNILDENFTYRYARVGLVLPAQGARWALSLTRSF